MTIELHFDKITLHPSAERLNFVVQHKLALIKFSTNVPGVDTTVCMVNEGESKELVHRAVDHMVKVSEKTTSLMLQEHKQQIHHLKALIDLQKRQRKSSNKESIFE